MDEQMVNQTLDIMNVAEQSRFLKTGKDEASEKSRNFDLGVIYACRMVLNKAGFKVNVAKNQYGLRAWSVAK